MSVSLIKKLVVLFLVLVFGSATPNATPTPQRSDPGYHKVVKIVDGDTIKANINDKVESVRLIGVDTPELKDPRKPVQCFAKEASEKTKELLEGKDVRLESDPTQGDRDKYQRLLRYVFLKDGTNFNKLLIEQGYAFEYTYDIPYKYQAEFEAAELSAREKGLGLWKEGVCEYN